MSKRRKKGWYAIPAEYRQLIGMFLGIFLLAIIILSVWQFGEIAHRQYKEEVLWKASEDHVRYLESKGYPQEYIQDEVGFWRKLVEDKGW